MAEKLASTLSVGGAKCMENAWCGRIIGVRPNESQQALQGRHVWQSVRAVQPTSTTTLACE